MSETLLTFFELLKQLNAAEAEKRLASPMLFVWGPDESLPLLNRRSCIAEEIINSITDTRPGWYEVIPVWLAQEFVESHRDEVLLGYSDELNAKFLAFAQSEW